MEKQVSMDNAELQAVFALACRFLGDTGICPADYYPANCQPEQCGDRGLWECWQKFFLERVANERVCRICGCTQDNACPGGCYWVEENLRSECAKIDGDS